MPPPRGEGMTGSPPSGPALPMRARAGDPTGVRLSAHPQSRETHQLSSPPSQACAERRRRRQGPAAADAVGPTGPILDPDAATGAAQKRRRTKEKDQPAVGRHSLTGPVLSGMTMPPRAPTPYPARRGHRQQCAVGVPATSAWRREYLSIGHPVRTERAGPNRLWSRHRSARCKPSFLASRTAVSHRGPARAHRSRPAD